MKVRINLVSLSALALGVALGGGSFWLSVGCPLPGSGLRAPVRLDGSRMPRAALRGQDLSHCSLVQADLSNADLGHANLRHACLREADLRVAGLAGADLRDADLRGADLRGANLQGAVLLGSRLEGALYDRTTSWPDGVEPSLLGAVPVPEEETRSARLPGAALRPVEAVPLQAEVMLQLRTE